MELRQLRHFEAAVRLGSINAAAEDQHVSQPSVTRSIQNLERQFGEKLLERTPQGVAPTTLGRSLYERATVIVGEADRARQELRAERAGLRGDVRIGVGPSYTRYLLAPAVSRILERHRGINLRIREGLYEDLTPMLRRGEIDVLFTQLPLDYREPELKYESLLMLRTHLVVRREHPLARAKEVTRKELSKTSWVVLNQEHCLRFHELFFSRHRLPCPNYAIRTNSPLAEYWFTLSANVVALLSEQLIEEDLAAGRLVKLAYKEPTLLTPGGLITMDGRPLSGAALRVIDEIRATCASQPAATNAEPNRASA